MTKRQTKKTPQKAEQDRESGIIDIHGREYVTVARRLVDFREKYPDLGIVTKITPTFDDEGRISRCYAITRIVRYWMHDDNPETLKRTVLATGHAFEDIAFLASNMHPSIAEVCETSAVGRALAIMGHVGSNVASAEEMNLRLDREEQRQATVDEYVPRILEAINADDMDGALELWDELSFQGKDDVWKNLDTHKRAEIRRYQGIRWQAKTTSTTDEGVNDDS